MHEFPLITTLAAAFTAAWFLGLLTQWMRLSPIVGYLLAGVLLGPHTPGFSGDIELANQLAEVGVILLMFGVGLHFQLNDLLAVKSIAIPGAIGQSLFATLMGIIVFRLLGLDYQTGAVLGMAMAVASTVVLMRVLMDADVLDSPQGHVAVGWLLVEDVLTVIVLVLVPVFGVPENPAAGAETSPHPVAAVALALVKLAALVGIVLFAGARIIPWVLVQVARLRSHELFTLTVMVFSVAIAAGAYQLFGASMALGAFLAGMVVAQSPVSHQAAADALPLRDAFAVLFFVSVGMLFDPSFVLREPLMMLGALGIILIAKPLAALVIVASLGHSVRTALTVAVGLAQIGEFSFILSETASEHGLLPEQGHTLLVGGAIISITLNPLLFRSVDDIEQWLRRHPRLWSLLNSRAERRIRIADEQLASRLGTRQEEAGSRAIVIGFGPVGQSVDRLLREASLSTVIVDLNMDTVADLHRQGRVAVFGDALRGSILEHAGIRQASHLVLTLPQSENRSAIVSLARGLNPRLKIFVRARYLREQEELERVGATATIIEEAEAAVALARLVLVGTGAGRESIENAVRDVRMRLILDNVSSLRSQTVRNIMIPWTRVRRLTRSAPLEEVRRQVGERHFSRWPVIDSETGLPIGYLLAKDLIGLSSNGSTWTSLIRPLSAVRSDDDVQTTLLRFQGDDATICLVRDGEVPVGIVTIEDILERMVDRIEDQYPRYPRGLLCDVVLTDDALVNLVSHTPEQAISEMAARIPSDRLPSNTDIVELAIERERELPTDLGFGIAIPHVQCPGLQQPLVVFGRSADGVVFDPRSPEPVHLIFLLVTPVEQPELQVLLLSQIARIAGDSGTRQRLRGATSSSDIAEILAAADG